MKSWFGQITVSGVRVKAVIKNNIFKKYYFWCCNVPLMFHTFALCVSRAPTSWSINRQTRQKIRPRGSLGPERLNVKFLILGFFIGSNCHYCYYRSWSLDTLSPLCFSVFTVLSIRMSFCTLYFNSSSQKKIYVIKFRLSYSLLKG